MQQVLVMHDAWNSARQYRANASLVENWHRIASDKAEFVQSQSPCLHVCPLLHLIGSVSAFDEQNLAYHKMQYSSTGAGLQAASFQQAGFSSMSPMNRRGLALRRRHTGSYIWIKSHNSGSV